MTKKIIICVKCGDRIYSNESFPNRKTGRRTGDKVPIKDRHKYCRRCWFRKLAEDRKQALIKEVMNDG